MGVRLKNITKIFKNLSDSKKEIIAVDNVNIDIKEGEMITLLGPSGCGKTTTLRIVSGFENPTSGEIWIQDKLVNNIPPNKRDTSMVFQSYAIFPHLTVAQNIGFGLELKGYKKSTIQKEVKNIMKVMNLEDMYNRRPDQLSGGQQQRVALARAIINKPKVLLFDEPLSNLDAKLREQMRLEIRRIQQTFKITSIYVTHDQLEAMTVSDRIAIMNFGKLQQIGTPFEIYSRPVNRFVADFIGRANFFPCKIEDINSDFVKVNFNENHLVINSFYGSFSVDETALIVIRPESLIINSSNTDSKQKENNKNSKINNTSDIESNIKNNYNLLTGKITKKVYLGATVDYEIETFIENKKYTILAVSHNPVERTVYDIGTNVTIDFNVKSAHLIKNS